MTDFSGYMIVTDLDGTFFGPHAAVIERNIEAVERFKAGGGIFTIATGRLSDAVEYVMPYMRTLVNAPVIACNGAELYDPETGKAIALRPLPPSTGKVLDFIFEKYPEFGIRVSCPEGFLVSPDNLAASALLRKDISVTNPDRVLRLPRGEWDETVWYKFVVRGEPEELEKLRDDLESFFPGDVSLSKSGLKMFEIQAPGTDKAVHIPFLREYARKKNGKNVFLFAAGDYENDIPMLLAADSGVCPANAIDRVKETADLRFCRNTEGLIADLVEYIEKNGDVKR